MMRRRLQKKLLYSFDYSLKRCKFITPNGHIAIQSTSHGVLTENQLNACRIYINKRIRKAGKVFIPPVVTIPQTKKPSQVRMGKGKGSISRLIHYTNPLEFLFELPISNLEMASVLCKGISFKLPVSVRLCVQDFYSKNRIFSIINNLR